MGGCVGLDPGQARCHSSTPVFRVARKNPLEPKLERLAGPAAFSSQAERLLFHDPRVAVSKGLGACFKSMALPFAGARSAARRRG
jgi:hypothetical protein